MSKFFWTFFILLWGYYVDAQEKLINGRIIIDVEDSSPEGIKVTNSRTRLTSITDIIGTFSLRAQIGDTLIIRSSQYESRNFILRESVFRKPSIDIHLNMQPIVLNEAVITPKLTGILEKDAKISEKIDPVTELYKELGIDPDKKVVRDTTQFTIGKDISIFHLNVEKVYDALSGDLRRRRNLFEYEGKEAKIEEIRKYFGDDYFTLDLGIPYEKIREFIYFSFETTFIPDYFETKNYFKIMNELNQTRIIYLNRLKNQPSSK